MKGVGVDSGAGGASFNFIKITELTSQAGGFGWGVEVDVWGGGGWETRPH